MVAFLTILSGALISLTVQQNGDLAAFMGTYHATALVHLVGLATVLLWILLRREKFRWDRSSPWYSYFGGILGVLTVLCNNITVVHLGVSVSLAVMLFGQALFGGLIDQFGWFGVQKRPFRPQHLISFALIIGGIAVMLMA